MKWKTAAGEEIEIKNMKTSHIMNVLKLFIKKIKSDMKMSGSYGVDVDDMDCDVEPYTKRDFEPYWSAMEKELLSRVNAKDLKKDEVYRFFVENDKYFQRIL